MEGTRGTRNLLSPEATEVVAVADVHLALLQDGIGAAVSRVQGLQPLAKLVQFTADVEKHQEDAFVGGIVAIVVHVRLHLLDKQCKDGQCSWVLGFI